MSQHSELIKRLEILDREIRRTCSIVSADRPKLLLMRKLLAALYAHFKTLEQTTADVLNDPDSLTLDPAIAQSLRDLDRHISATRDDMDRAPGKVPLADPDLPDPDHGRATPRVPPSIIPGKETAP